MSKRVLTNTLNCTHTAPPPAAFGRRYGHCSVERQRQVLKDSDLRLSVLLNKQVVLVSAKALLPKQAHVRSAIGSRLASPNYCTHTSLISGAYR
jgi:hypothetical protein